jgi:beta-N-acetylhexosaminidase
MKSRATHHGIRWVLLLLLLLTVVPPLRAQEAPTDPVMELMARMSPEAKVGQLVLVTYPGTNVGETSEIYSLIRDSYVGGVLLRPQNANFGAAGITAVEMVSITNQLQAVIGRIVPDAERVPADELDLIGEAPYIPLLISVAASEYGVSPLHFISDTSDPPTAMAVGATWNLALSRAVGNVLGRELSALGINLFLGPNIDVLYTPKAGDPADLGTRVFGGDPFWVGEMGTAYIAGLHEGSEGALAVAPRHLPGLGSADRPLEEEVPTVQKPLEQLKQVDLVPFFAAARNPPGETLETADGFLVTHIRYRGFQGNNIRRTTRPISLDAPALQLVTSLREVEPWRAAGGLLIADNLGLPSVHQSYDPTGLTFNARRVTQDALSAGNDLLILDRFGSPVNWNTHFTNVRDTLSFLAARYRDEPTFQTLVDAAVYRVLSLKLRIMPSFEPDDLQRDGDAAVQLLRVGGDSVASSVAQAGLSLIFPLSEDVLPSPPREGELIAVFTQERGVSLGSAVEPVILLRRDWIPNALLRFYGPDGTAIIRDDAVRGFTFEDLVEALDAPAFVAEDAEPLPETVVAVRSALQRADWLIFATGGLDAGDPSGVALKRFLGTQANLLDARIVVLAFGPPYELDTTEISKLAAYYGLFSPGPAFVEAGVRALFQDVVAPGAPPVDVPALNYLISERTMPSPEQIISLAIVNEAGEELTATAQASIHVSDMINLQTGIIVDGNGNTVPDGTPVQFILAYPQEGLRTTVVGETVRGIAKTTVTLDRVGQLDITAQSEPAASSVRLELTIRDDGVTITEVEPTPTPTLAPSPTPTLTPTPTPTPTPHVVPVKNGQLPDRMVLPSLERTALILWAFAGAGLSFLISFLWARDRSLAADRAATLALEGVIGGLAVYVLVMALARWWLPVVRFGLVGREYLGVLLTGSSGLAVARVAGKLRRRELPASAPQVVSGQVHEA